MSAPNWWGDWRPSLTPHTGNLLATDLIECTMIVGGLPVNTVITGAQILGAVPTPSVAWGSITGTLSSQTDLNTALSGKASTGAVTGTGITMSTARILGRSTAGTGAIEEITIGSGLTLSAGTLTASGGGLTVGTTAITSGTVGRVLFQGTGNVLQQSANLFWDNTNNRLGIGGTPGAFNLDVNGTARVATSLEIINTGGITFGGGATALNYTGNQLHLGNSASWTDVRFYAGAVQKFSQTSSLTTITNTTINLSTATVQLGGVNTLTYSGTDIRIGSVAAGFNSLSMYVAGSERARIASTGNVLIGTTTDAGFKLDVNGTARVSGLLTTPAGTNLAGWYLYANGTTQATMFGGTSWILDTVLGGGYRFRTAGNVDRLRIESSGNVLIGTSTDVASSLVTMESTTKGFLPPRMTTTQKNAIASPAAGLIVYDTTLAKLCVRTASAWETITSV